MNRELLKATLTRCSPRLIKRLKEYTKFPTSRNECYMIGYITALEESNQLEYEDYSYLLSVCGQVREGEDVLRALRELLK